MALNPTITDWRGKTVWIVGASSGMGRETAHLLHQRGAHVIVSARSAAPLEAFTATHDSSLAVPLDITVASEVAAAARRVHARYGQLDLVFVCAGHYKPQRATAFDLAEMLRHQQVNYVGALHVLDAVLPKMIKARHGHLSLMGSVAGYRGLPQALAYGPTKAALNNLADVMYMDLHDLGLGVSIVNPGFVDTPLTAQNNFRMPALMTAADAAKVIVRGWERGAFEVHFPRRLTLSLKTLQSLWHGVYFATVRRATGL